MVDPLTPSDLVADRVTPAAVIVEQDRYQVSLTSRLTAALAQAARGGKVLQILTPSTSRLTYPLEVLLRDGGGQWVVRDGPGFRDGLTGAPLRWSGELFTPSGPAPPPTSPPLGGIEIDVVTHHPAAALRLGTAADAVARACTGVAPTGWGVAEPATQPWSPRELTAHCRDRAPDPTALVVVGEGLAGTIHVGGVAAGVAERVRITTRVMTPDERDALAEELSPTVRTMAVGARAAGSRPAGHLLPPVPHAVLIGASVVEPHGAEHARRAPATRVRMLGPACWCILTGGAVAPFEQLAAVLTHFREPAQVSDRSN